MADEDVLEQARAAGLTIATGVSRLGDTFIRAAQQRADADVRDKQLQVEEAQRRYEAQAQVADQLYRRAADPDWMRSVDQAEALGVWEAAQLWADLDQERFRTAADQVTVAYQEAYGHAPSAAHTQNRGTHGLVVVADYDSGAARSARAAALGDAGWPREAIRARVLSDQLNSHDPQQAPAQATNGRSAVRPAVVQRARPQSDRAARERSR
jgi:hypothetical protein